MKKVLLIALFLIGMVVYGAEAVVFEGSLSQEERLAVMTLAGIVNRTTPKLYLLNVYETWSYNKTDEKWMELYQTKGGVNFQKITSFDALISKFKGDIKGAITYDKARIYNNFTNPNYKQTILWQGEFAAVIGSLTDRIPLTKASADRLGLNVSDTVTVKDYYDGDPDVFVTGRLESSSNSWNSSSLGSEEKRYLNLIDWGLTNLLPRCNPSKVYMREYTDLTSKFRMFQVNLAGTDPEKELNVDTLPTVRADKLEKIFNFMQAKSNGKVFHVYGWFTPEPLIQWIALFGGSFHETLMSNISWHSAFTATRTSFKSPASIDAESAVLDKNKIYLLLMCSEGDAGNWVIGRQGGAWDSSERGNIPVTWGWNLHLLELAPLLAEYYYDSATKNDGFAGMTSPLGYAYPDVWPENVFNSGLEESKNLANKYNIKEYFAYKHYAPSGVLNYRGKTINNSFNFSRLAKFNAGMGTKLTLLFDPKLAPQTTNYDYGTLFYNNHDALGNSYGDNNVCFYGNTTNINSMANRILKEIKKKSLPGFYMAAYNRYVYDGAGNSEGIDMTMANLKTLINLVKADPQIGSKVEFVTMEKYSMLLRQKLGIVTPPVTSKINLKMVSLEQMGKNSAGYYRMKATIKNENNKSLSSFGIELWMNKQDLKQRVDTIAANSTKEVIFDTNIVAGGSYNYAVLGDCENEIAEDNENDNKVEGTIKIESTPNPVSFEVKYADRINVGKATDFNITATSGIAKVTIIIDDKWTIGSADVKNGSAKITYTFSGAGNRKMVVKGLNSNGVETVTPITKTIVVY